MGTFTATIKGWAAETEQRMAAVFRQSVADTFAMAQRPVAEGGNMPVDTGFLRASLVAQLNGSTIAGGQDAYQLAVTNAELGDTIFGGWTAEYALPVEKGNRGRAPRNFMRSAANMWPRTVARNAEKARERNT